MKPNAAQYLSLAKKAGRLEAGEEPVGAAARDVGRELDHLVEEVSGYWRFYDQEGNLTEQQEWTYPEASIVFTFYGPEEEYNMPEFRFGWLPEGEHYEQCFRSDYAADGWGNGFGAFCSHDHIPCQIFAYELDTRGRMSVLNAEPVTIVELQASLRIVRLI